MSASVAAGAPGAPARVQKRDGTCVAFDVAKIESALARAGAAAGEFAADEARRLAAALAPWLAPDGGMASVEAIQDAVELALLAAGHYRTARAYIAYREQHAALRRDRQTVVDVAASIKNTSRATTGASTPTPTRATRSAA